MRSTQARVLALSVLVVAGCRSKDGGGSTPTPPPTVMVSFSGTVDASAGTVSIWTDPPAAASAQLALLQEIPVVQDGKPGTGPADTVELVTEGIQTIAGGCGAVDGYEAAVRLRSFYAGAVVTNVHVEITSMTPTGREACNSSAPYETLSDQFGLWDYGTVGRAGSGFNAVLRPWRFRLPDTTRFVFRGHVVADLVTADPNPPTTVAIPGTGTFIPGTSVTLSCTDAETGCAATYYTTDGSLPTTSSQVYTGPIRIWSNTTLQWFSVDYWGNAESPQAALYVPDSTAPRVVATDPANGSSDVPADAAVMVTFSESMDAAATAAAISLSGPAGVVAGTVTWDTARQVFTFIPTAPLVEDAYYTITVAATARDPAGNRLAGDFSAWFTTASLMHVVSGPGSATLEPGGIAFDGAGDGLAVWRGADRKVLYSCYRAASATWSPAAQLAADRWSAIGREPQVAASATGFAVAWLGVGSVVNASVFTGCTPGPIQTLTTDQVSYWVAVGSSGSSFLVAWSGFRYGSYAALFDGTSWTQQRFTSHANADEIAIAGEGAVYRILYISSGTVYSVRRVGGVWSSPASLGNGTRLALASEGDATCMAWYDRASTTVNGRMEVNGSGTTAAAIPSGQWPWGPVSAAMNGGRCQVVAGSYKGAVGARYEAGAWSPASAVAPSGWGSAVGVAPLGEAEFAAVALVDGNLWVNRTAAGAWGTAQAAESRSEPARLPCIASSSASGTHVFFAQAEDAADQVWTAPYDGSTAALAEVRSTTVIDGKSFGVRMAAAANGDTMAIWGQQHRGLINVFWALRQAGVWGTPQLLAEDADALIAAVASNGTDFMVVYAVGASYDTLVARRFAGGAFGAPTTIASGYGSPSSMVLASDGTGYALGYMGYDYVESRNRPRVQIYDGAAWGEVKSLTSGESSAQQVSLAGRPGEYLAAWIDEASTTTSAKSWRAVQSGATWNWEAAPATIASSAAYPFTVAAGPGGFVAAYALDYTLNAAMMSGGLWGAPATLRTGNVFGVAVASNGDGYMVATLGNPLRVHAWNGAWQAGRDVGYAVGNEIWATSDGSGYGVFVNAQRDGLVFVSVPEPVSGAIGAPVHLNTEESTDAFQGPALVSTATGYMAAWAQRDPADPTLIRIYARGGL